MIKELIDRFNSKEDELRQSFIDKEPYDYGNLVEHLVSILYPKPTENQPSYKNILSSDYTDHSGDYVFFITPNSEDYNKCFWYVSVSYGSCSGCDSILRLADGDKSTRVKDWISLSLHIIQDMKKVDLE